MSEGRANAELIRPPTSEGGVWGSFVEYLERLEVAAAERDGWRNQDQQVRDDFADALRDLERAEVLIDQIEAAWVDPDLPSVDFDARLYQLLAVYRNEVGK